MVNNYESRINDFVLKMVEKPIIVKKEKDKYSTSRQEFLALSSKKILDKKGFQFKSYKSDRERISEIIKSKESLDKYLQKIEILKKRKEKINKKKNEPKLIQPSMRFKARTDLERVYDILKNRENLYSEEKIIKNQLAKMGFASHYIDDEEDLGEYEEEIENNLNNLNNTNIKNLKYEILSEEERYKKELHNKIIQQRKNMINKRKFLLDVDRNRRIDNSKAKSLMGELYQKTHFKTMENLSLFKTSTINHNIFKKWKHEDEEKQQNIKIKNIKEYNNIFNESMASGFPNLYNNGNKMSLKKKMNEYKELEPSNELSNNKSKNNTINYYSNLKTIFRNKDEKLTHKKNKSTNQKKKINFIGNKKILEDFELTKEIANTNPLLFNLNFSNIKNDNHNLNSTIDKLNILRKMAFEQNNEILDESSSNNIFPRNEFEDLKKEENVIIDGKEFKKTETYKIADKILKKCQYNENKHKYKSNEGGLMFTNGLTIKEFEAKYGL